MSSKPADGTATQHVPVNSEDVRLQLERVLGSSFFRNSRRCHSLLQYVTNCALAGDSTALKERTLGIEVFERAPNYDTNQDPVVRTTAAEVRKRLAQYYQQPEHEHELRIAFSPGSYVPEFHPGHAPAPVVSAADPLPARRTWKGAVLAGAAALLVTLAAGSGWYFARGSRSALDQFWKPLIDAPGSMLLCMGQPFTYDLVFDPQYDLLQTIKPVPAEPAIPEPKSMPTNQMVPMRDRYIALDDAKCLIRLTALLENRHKPYHMRGAASTAFNDLREQPAVLIGAFDNEWTLRALAPLRFTFHKEIKGDVETESIRDKDHPERSDWRLVGDWPYWKIPNDYAIVTRMHDENTDRIVVIAAGITAFGTVGAGEFISSSQYFAEALPLLPKNWEKRNLEIVLKVPVVKSASGHPHVLAAHVW